MSIEFEQWLGSDAHMVVSGDGDSGRVSGSGHCRIIEVSHGYGCGYGGGSCALHGRDYGSIDSLDDHGYGCGAAEGSTE